jgi:DNA gyrase/topoisomerase IV subunit A
MEKDEPKKELIFPKEDIFLEHLNHNKNPLKNEEFIKGSLETFDKFFNEEETIKNSNKNVNQSIDYSCASFGNNCFNFNEKIVNGGKEKNISLKEFIKDKINENNTEKVKAKTQLFNTLQESEMITDSKKRKLIMNRESAKKSRLKKKKYIENLEKEIAELDDILKSKARVKTIIVKELKAIADKYGQPRRSLIIYEDTAVYVEEKETVDDFACTFFFTKEGYFKKIKPLSLRMGSNQKLKDGDEIIQTIELSNDCDLLFFSDKAQVYKAKANDFSDTKASALGDYVAAKLGMDEGENAVYMVATRTTKALCSSALKTASLQKFRLNPMQLKQTAKS